MTVPNDAGRVLLPLARAAIASRFGRRLPVPEADWLHEPGACFVTLKINDRLRGCIGSLASNCSLRDDVWSNARRAAFRDPRFPPLSEDEFDQIRIEVSVLTEAVPMSFTSRAEALAQLVPGVDGVILTSCGRKATFLPQVWEQLPQPEEFVRALMCKAGLAADHWDAETGLACYRVAAWAEAGPLPDAATTGS